MSNTIKIIIVAVLALAIILVVILKQTTTPNGEAPVDVQNQANTNNNEKSPNSPPAKAIPRLVDVGARTCIPCKMMAPILEGLKKEYAGRLQVDFLDLSINPDYAGQYKVRVIPTQIFYDASGRELFRHEGFYSKEDILAKFKQLGVDLTAWKSATFEQLTPARIDNRPKENICFMCDVDINPKALVTVQSDKGPVRLCSPHCYFIMYSCLTKDKTDFEKRVSVTDWSAGNPIQATEAVFLYGQDETTGRPWIRAFADQAEAARERAESGGNILSLKTLQETELSHRCGFCERACYPQDAAEVIIEGGVHTWGCCSHCALGVAARTGKNIEVREKDRLTKEKIIVKTFDGKIASLEPATAIAWFGQRKKPDGTWGSAGCFHQGFFVNADNLKKWVDKNPYETGRLISIHQALAAKMKLSPEQISKACKIGECVPK
jgi:thioredoxin 1